MESRALGRGPSWMPTPSATLDKGLPSLSPSAPICRLQGLGHMLYDIQGVCGSQNVVWDLGLYKTPSGVLHGKKNIFTVTLRHKIGLFHFDTLLSIQWSLPEAKV